MSDEIKIEGNIDINQAIKEFETKSQIEQAEKVVEKKKNSDLPKMVQMIIKYSDGAIKDQRQAEWVLLGFAVVALGISFYLFFGRGVTQQKNSAEILKQAELLEQMKQIPENK